MKKLSLAVGFVVAIVLGTASSANAGHSDHSRYHDDLNHRAFHRELYHRDAHRYPMTWRQHGRLHDALEHDAYHDSLEHRRYHRGYRHYPSYRGGYYSRGGGFSIHGPRYGFSIRF